MRRQYTLIAPKGEESKVRMDRHLFNMHCDTQRILHEAGEIILQHQKAAQIDSKNRERRWGNTSAIFRDWCLLCKKGQCARTFLPESKDPVAGQPGHTSAHRRFNRYPALEYNHVDKDTE